MSRRGRHQKSSVPIGRTLTIVAGIHVLLGAGETRIIHVEVDVVSVVEGVDWSQATIEEGKAVVDEDSPLMDGLRSRLAVAFSVGSID